MKKNTFFISKVLYEGDLTVNMGDELTPTEVRDLPIKINWNAEPTSFYTLVFIGN